MIQVKIGDIEMTADFGDSAKEVRIYNKFMQDIMPFAELLADAAALEEHRNQLENATPEDFIVKDDDDE